MKDFHAWKTESPGSDRNQKNAQTAKPAPNKKAKAKSGVSATQDGEKPSGVPMVRVSLLQSVCVLPNHSVVVSD